MKRLFTVIVFFLCCGLASRAQVFIINDNILTERLCEVKASVVDSLTNEPLAFASVYVIPVKDTTITNFTLTDAEGAAKLEDVPFGNYTFHVEMMGYKSVVRERYFRQRAADMGTIRLQVDENYLQAAVVSDVGNPIVIKKDTVEFNASSFYVGANAMLKDLLKRMPGMEITDDGKVKFNGEEIDKLTVGGRTFFFNDQSTALNNLPASVVDKIRVIDRESEATRASGLQDGSREKVLDVGLKKEYEKGWFGNAALKGGATLGGKDDDNPLRDDRGLLYSANALVSAYGEKDQVTFIANGQNINDSNSIFVLVTSDDEEFRSDVGLSSAAQLGLNANSSRIKDVDATVSANYKYSDMLTGTKSDRTTYQDDGDLNSSTENSGRQFTDSFSTNMEFEKEKGKVWFHIRPGFRYDKTNSLNTGTSSTSRVGSFVNSSENSSHNLSTSTSTEITADVTFRELWGKDKRTLRLRAGGNYDAEDGESDETSVLKKLDRQDVRTMNYDSDGRTTWIGGYLNYNEPLGEKWTLAASANISASKRDRVRDAFDAAGKNEYYSSVSNTNYIEQSYDMTAQYKFGEQSWITLGGTVLGTLNEVYSKSYGVEALTGEDEWDWHIVPTLRIQHSKGNDRFNISTSGYTQRPSPSRMLPVLNITDPSRLSLGNIYLRPGTQMSFFSQWTRNNVKRFSNLMAYLFGDMTLSPSNYARWYDSDGILYAIPVNSRKPRYALTLSGNYTTPLDEKKNWSLTVSGNASFNSLMSYQAKTMLPGLDKDTFDYSAFMKEFWGGADGDRFYSGRSGFAESRTLTLNPYFGIDLKYNRDHYSFNVGTNLSGNIARYSLDPSINMNTFETDFDARGTYSTKHEFEFISDITYAFYRGYSEGYGQPEWRWNAEISKNIGAFNLSVKVHDILNQTNNLTHTVNANYEEDTYQLIMGRWLLFGVKWNFGKMNAAHNQRAQNAAWNMVW